MSESPQAPVALITGGNSGIGRATALAFAAAGRTSVWIWRDFLHTDVIDPRWEKLIRNRERLREI